MADWCQAAAAQHPISSSLWRRKCGAARLITGGGVTIDLGTATSSFAASAGQGQRHEGTGALRLDRAVLDHFRAGGPGWQTRINDALATLIRSGGNGQNFSHGAECKSAWFKRLTHRDPRDRTGQTEPETGRGL